MSESDDGLLSDRRRGGAVLSNVSPDGISFETNFKPLTGDCLRLELRPIEGPELSAKIKVLHSRQSEKNGFFAVGSRFEEISEGDRRNLLQLIATINRMQHELA
jgi:c-di-GMP-binding flagellar brake protein YcgR